MLIPYQEEGGGRRSRPVSSILYLRFKALQNLQEHHQA